MAARHANRRDETPPWTKLSRERLASFLWAHDTDRDEGKKPDMNRYAATYKISANQLRLIASGKSRTTEVKEIRAAQLQPRTAMLEHSRHYRMHTKT